MEKPPKRLCPQCGNAVRVVKSINIIKTETYIERLQHLKCQQCEQRGVLVTKEYVEWRLM